MAASALLSMWISNTATTLMLLPVALAVIERAQPRLAIPLLLGLAYAASVGGMGTPIGTPPNLIFMSVYAEQIGNEPTFIMWMGWGVPVVVCMLPIMALWLTRSLRLTRPIDLPEPGQWRIEEIRVMAIFSITALLWITRTAPFGGWREWLHLPTANDASVALLAVVALAMTSDGQGGQLLDWKTARKIPWGVLILFGGGICIATAFVESGLADLIAANLAALASVPPWLLLITVCLSVTFLTEITSNTATASLLMPLLAATAIGAGIDPKLLMIPAAMSASCAFMLPVATAPNAIIYGSGQVTVARMAREGFVLNLIGAGVISGFAYWFFV
jgi:sodium-dependent dicarboxylate transporter 2/3/5